MWFVLLFLSLTLAQEPAGEPEPAPAPEAPSAARQCADAARGREVEVCLALAADHPEEVTGIAAALRAHVDRSAGDDRALLSALLLLLSADTAVEGAARLGDLGDPRAVGPLADAGQTREVPVAVAAARALGNYHAGLEALSRWVEDRQMPPEVRAEAARSLGIIGDPSGGDVLLATLRTRRVPGVVRQAMIETVETHFPDRVGEIERQVSQNGTWWLVGSGAFGLGYSLGVVGYLGRGDLAWLGVVTGAAAGGVGGWAVGRTWPMEAADAAFITSAGVMGTTSGIFVGVGATDGEATGAWVGGLVGEAVGYGLGIGLRKLHRGTVVDSLEATGFGGFVGLGTGIITDLALGWRGSFGSGNVPLLAAGIGLGAGTVVGHLVAPLVHSTALDTGLWGLSAAYGLGAALLVPVDEPRGIGFAGLAVGSLVGYGIGAFADPTGDVLLGSLTGMGLGGFIGAGVGLLADPNATSDGRAWRVGALTGATLGLAGGAVASWRNPEPWNGNDVVFTALVTGWATWQSVGWYNVTYPPPAWDGLFVMAPAVAGSVTALVSPFADIPASWSLTALSFGLFGGYIGGTTAELIGVPGETVLMSTLIGSDLGLGLGYFFAAPPIRMPLLVLALGDAGGVLGGALAAMITTFFVDPNSPGGVDKILASSLGGLAVGWAGGAVLGWALYKGGQDREVALVPLPHVDLPGQWALMPTVLQGKEGPAYGGMLQVSGW